MISIIVRTKNEERWIRQCLERILVQEVDESIEVVLVDNNSTDKTVEKAKQIIKELIIVNINSYKPGFAINEGVRASAGNYIVCLSAHCLPSNPEWLKNLKNNLYDESIAGVYGRQIPMKYSEPSDKRDLIVTFGLDKRIQKKDTFFHNANSMLRREMWDKFPFDEEVTNIEDRVWGKQVIDAGYSIIYEPDAAVFHYHGIHQNNNVQRCENVIRIMEDIKVQPEEEIAATIDPEELNITAIVPIRGNGSNKKNQEILIAQTFDIVKQSKYLTNVVVSTDDEKIAGIAEQHGASITIMRPSHLSANTVRVNEVLKFTLDELENKGNYSDLILSLEITYPFRPNNLIDKMILKIINGGFDTVIAGFPEYRPCWNKQSSGYERLDNHSIPRNQREPLHIGLLGLACITYPEFIRKCTRIGERVGVYEIDTPLSAIELRNDHSIEIYQHFLKLLQDINE